MRGLINLDRANWMTRDGRYEPYEVSRHFTLRFQPKGTDEMELSVAPANLRAALTLQCLAHRAGGARTRSCKRAARSLRSVARAGVDPTKRFAQTGVGLTSTIAERVQGRAECYPSVTRLGCSSRAIAGIAGVYGDTAPDALRASAIAPPFWGSIHQGQQAQILRLLNRRSSGQFGHLIGAPNVSEESAPTLPRPGATRTLSETVLANPSRELEGWASLRSAASAARAVWLWRGWTPSAPAQSFCSQLFQSRICCPTSRVIKDRRRRNMEWVQLPKHKGTRNVSDEADRALRSAR
jgi:hypothetical protein